MVTASLLVALCLAQTGGKDAPAPAQPPPAAGPPAELDDEVAPGLHPAPKATAAPKPPAPGPLAPSPKPAAPVVTILHPPINGAPGSPAAGKPGAPAVSGAAAAAEPILDVADGTARVSRAIIARDIEALVVLTPPPFSFDGLL